MTSITPNVRNNKRDAVPMQEFRDAGGDISSVDSPKVGLNSHWEVDFFESLPRALPRPPASDLITS